MAQGEGTKKKMEKKKRKIKKLIKFQT